ncbi:MAG: ice-binding family protein, partial [Pelolinea sp.]|nr:ice-binding family protein [Pelolinea sp.]
IIGTILGEPYRPNKMRKPKYLMISIIVVLSLVLVSQVYARPLAATSPTLGAAEPFVILAGSAITNVPTSKITGDVGLKPAAGSYYAGLTAAEVTGKIYAVDASGPAGSIKAPALLNRAQIANFAAFDKLDQKCDVTYPGVKDLAGESLVPGVYCAGAFELSGTLTLSGTADEVWIFKSASTLITSGTANVVGPTDACYVWWRVVSSATLGTYTSLIGNILAHISIALQTGATLNGRALAQIGAVTLDSNTITYPICVGLPPAGTRTPNVTQIAQTQTAGPSATAIAQTQTAAAATPKPKKTATPAPVGPGLPKAGSGAPILNTDFLWGLLIGGGISAMVLVGVRAFRRTNRPNQ